MPQFLAKGVTLTSDCHHVISHSNSGGGRFVSKVLWRAFLLLPSSPQYSVHLGLSVLQMPSPLENLA
jgi:hypothetical protein